MLGNKIIFKISHLSHLPEDTYITMPEMILEGKKAIQIIYTRDSFVVLLRNT